MKRPTWEVARPAEADWPADGPSVIRPATSNTARVGQNVTQTETWTSRLSTAEAG